MKTLAEVKDYAVYGEYDIVVVGGGMAGCGAALSAARAGKKTILVETTSGLGGLATMGLVNIPLDFASGVGKDFFKRMDAQNGMLGKHSDPEVHKRVLDEMMADYGSDLLLVTPLIDAVVEGDYVKGIIVYTKEGHQVIYGKQFIDASGDSDLMFYAGGETVTGRPGDHMSMGCSMDFVISGVDWNKWKNSDIWKNDPNWLKPLAKAINEGRLPDIDNHRNWTTHLPGRPMDTDKDEVCLCICHSRNCYPTNSKDLTRMYLEGRQQCQIIHQWVKETMPGFENSWLSYTAPLLGVRESRRIVGEYVFTGMDIAYARSFDDVIAVSQHGFDLHGFEASGNMKWFKGKLPDGQDAYICNRGGWGSQFPPEDGLPRVNMKDLIPDPNMFWYEIPFRSLVPVRINNVLAAGRNISTDIPGQSGIRLVMCCMAQGEAAGAAAAQAIDTGKAPRDIDVAQLQRTLVGYGCNLGQAWRKLPALGEDFVAANDTVKLFGVQNG